MKFQSYLSLAFAVLVFAVLVLAGAQPVVAQDDVQTVALPLSRPGETVELRVKVTRGSIFVQGYDGSDVIVEGRNAAHEFDGHDDENESQRDGMRRLNTKSIAFAVEEKDNVVEVTSKSWNEDIRFDIKVPRRASLNLRTVNNGDVEVRDIEGELDLGNTNGDIAAYDISGSITAATTNGDVTVTMTKVTANKAMAFTTLNGDIDVTFPSNLKADLRMRSSYGDLLTDFDVQVSAAPPKIEREATGSRVQVKVENEVSAKVGGGGPEFTFKSFHGDVVVRKGG
ncbi:MAG: DUF4097 family beta strand repeat-containing protein [Acidobacteriota bacterium]